MSAYLQRLLARVAPASGPGIAASAASTLPAARLASPLADSDQRLHLPGFEGLIGLETIAETRPPGMGEQTLSGPAAPDPAAAPPTSRSASTDREDASPARPTLVPPAAQAAALEIAATPVSAAAPVQAIGPDPKPRLTAPADPFDIPPDALKLARPAELSGAPLPPKEEGEGASSPPVQHAAPVPALPESPDTGDQPEPPAPADAADISPAPAAPTPAPVLQPAMPAPIPGPAMLVLTPDRETPLRPASRVATELPPADIADEPASRRPDRQPAGDQAAARDPPPRTEPKAIADRGRPPSPPMTAAAASVIGPLPARRSTPLLYGMRRA